MATQNIGEVMAINMLVVGRRSELANDFINSIGDDYCCVHVSASDDPDEVQEKLKESFKGQPFDVLDFTVYANLQMINRAMHAIASLAPRSYVMLSTEMHNREDALFLSSYRKLKLLQEKVARKSFGSGLKIVRLPDVIDSRAWLSHLSPDGVYRFQSYFDFNKKMLGVTKRDVLDFLDSCFRGEQVDLVPVRDFTFAVDRLGSFKGRLRARIKLVLSRSLLFGRVISILRRGSPVTSASYEYRKVDLAGGYADLV